MRKRYKTIGVGGTFDHFHDGHGQLLQFAANLADSLLIGITDDRMTRHKNHSESIERFDARLKNVSQFCNRHRIAHHITKLSDGIGPTLEDAKVQALAVTSETVVGANKINELRSNLGLRELPVYICDFLLTENKQPLHATAIRDGHINRQGTVYANLFSQPITLTASQRDFFQQPQGEILHSANPSTTAPLIAVVGDNCLKTFVEKKLPYHLGVFDGIEQRQASESEVLNQLQIDTTVSNAPGIITTELIESLQKMIQTPSKKHLKVEGEEDLAAVALVLLAPLESEIYYGQPNQGMVKMIVTEDLKEAFFASLTSQQ